MIDNTRSYSLSRLEEVVTLLTQNQSALTSTQSSLHFKLDEVISLLHTLETASPIRSSRHQPPRMNLEVPCFDGTDTMSWIIKISQFFYYHGTLDDERLQVAFFYLDGLALSWFQWIFRSDQSPSWYGFLQALEMHFAPSFYDDPHDALLKLSQEDSIDAYLSEFQALANRIVGLPLPFLLSCFISSLSLDICREVLALQPLSLV